MIWNMYQYHDTILYMYQVSVSWYFFSARYQYQYHDTIEKYHTQHWVPVNVFNSTQRPQPNKTVTIAVYNMSIESFLRITQWIN